MGYSTYSSDAYRAFSDTAKTKSTGDLFSNRSMVTSLNPKGVTRECRISANHPDPVAIIINLDVTGSMGSIPAKLLKETMSKLIELLIKHGIKSPSICFTAVGDHISDEAPFQAGQFENGTDELIKCLSEIWIEGMGGGQNKESYLLAWDFAVNHTAIDRRKNGKKSYLFTIGDEGTWPSIDGSTRFNIFGKSTEGTTAKSLLVEANRNFEVFHIHINTTNYRDGLNVINPWKDLLGERVIMCNEPDNVAEMIAATVALHEGIGVDVLSSDVSYSTLTAVQPLSNSLKPTETGVITFS